MTDAKMALLELVEQEADADLVREMLAFAAERMMDLDVEAKTGAPAGKSIVAATPEGIRVKIRDEGMVRNKAIHIALGVRADGGKEVLGLWLEQNEGAKFWLRVMNELRNRGTEDILLAVVDGLKGFPDAITAMFPDAVVQTPAFAGAGSASSICCATRWTSFPGRTARASRPL